MKTKTKTKKNKVFFQIYDSVNEFIDAVNTKSPHFKNEDNIKEWKRLVDSTRQDFHGDFQDVLKKMREQNFSTEASLMSGAMEDINFANFSETAWEFRQRLEEGDSVDVNRYLDGQDKYWNGVRRKPRTKQVVRVYASFGGNWRRTDKELAMCGATGVTLCEILESMGVGVELWAVQGSSDFAYDVASVWNRANNITLIKLKNSYEFFNLGLVNYILGDKTVFRNADFRTLVKSADENGYCISSNFGSSMQVDADMLGMTDEEKKTSIFIPFTYTAEEARAVIKKILSKPIEK